jgi:hypothetical protein
VLTIGDSIGDTIDHQRAKGNLLEFRITTDSFRPSNSDNVIIIASTIAGGAALIGCLVFLSVCIVTKRRKSNKRESMIGNKEITDIQILELLGDG